MVGRDAELGFLSDQYDRAARGPGPAGAVVWIDGALGSGKSRLVSEFATRVRTSREPPLFLYGRCPAREEQRPAAPVLGLLMSWLGMSLHTLEPGPRERAQLERLLPPREVETLMRTLEAHFDGATEFSLQEALARWLIALGKRRAHDRVPRRRHLREPRHLERDLLGRARPGRDAHAAAARPARARARAPARALARLRQQLEGQHELRVGPIDAAAVRKLVDLTFHSSAPRLRIARVLMSRSRGNPGMIAEILRALTDRGEAVPHASGGGLTLRISPERLPLPASLQALTRERYRRLPPADRRWLRRFSVVGGRLQADFLARALAPATAREIDDALVRLTKAGWLAPRGRALPLRPAGPARGRLPHAARGREAAGARGPRRVPWRRAPDRS